MINNEALKTVFVDCEKVSFPRSRETVPTHRIKWLKTWFANGYVFRCV